MYQTIYIYLQICVRVLHSREERAHSAVMNMTCVRIAQVTHTDSNPRPTETCQFEVGTFHLCMQARPRAALH